MTKVVYKSLKSERSAKSAERSVGTKRVRDAEGKWKVVHKLDANSASFDEDFRYVFSKSVAKARKENRRLAGTAVATRKR